MSTTHGAVKTRCHEDTTDDVYLVGAGCVVCAQVRMGLGSGSKVWNPGTWIRCVLHSGKARLTMSGYLNEILMTSGVTGTARTPATDTLFEADATKLVSEDVRVWFHRVVAQVLYLANRTRETLTWQPE
jgi:hypothetical protein